MTTQEPTTAETTTTAPIEPTPTPASKVQPDDGSAPLSSLRFFCATCGAEIQPTDFQVGSDLQRPQTRYTYSCLTCEPSTGSGGARFDMIVFHASRQTKA